MVLFFRVGGWIQHRVSSIEHRDGVGGRKFEIRNSQIRNPIGLVGRPSEFRIPNSDIEPSSVDRARLGLNSCHRMLGLRGFAFDEEAEAGDAAADPDLVAVAEKGGLQEALTVEVGAVLGTEVLDGGGGSGDLDPCVAARDLGAVDTDVRVTRPAHDVRALGEWHVSVAAEELERQGHLAVGRNRCGDRVHVGHQPVTTPGDVLDEGGVSGVVAEGGSQFGDDLGERVIGDELGLPDRIDEILLGGQLAGSQCQVHEDLHGARTQLDQLAVIRDPVERGLDQPFAESKGLPRRRPSILLLLHVGESIEVTLREGNRAGRYGFA